MDSIKSSIDYEFELTEKSKKNEGDDDIIEGIMEEYQEISDRAYKQLICSERGQLFDAKDIHDQLPVVVISTLIENVKKSFIKIKYPTYIIEISGNRNTGVKDYYDVDLHLKPFFGYLDVKYAGLNVSEPEYICWKDTVKENINLKNEIKKVLEENGYIIKSRVGVRFTVLPIQFSNEGEGIFWIDQSYQSEAR